MKNNSNPYTIMRKYIFILLAALTFVACSEDDNTPKPNNDEYSSKSGIRFATEGYIFTAHKDGTITPNIPVNQPMEKTMEADILGHAWKFMDGYEIKADGTIGTTPLLKFPWTLADIPDYYINKTTVRELATCEGSKGAYYNQEYTWKREGKTFTFMDKERTEEDITVLSYDPETRIMAIMHHARYGSVMNHFYEILFYQRMSDEEAEAQLQAYENGPYKFTKDEEKEGCYRSLNPESFSTKDFQRYVVGQGWKFQSSHLILEDCSIQPEDFLMHQTGLSPMNYYFDKEQATTYFLSSDMENMQHRVADYEYMPETGLLSISDSRRGLSIISYDEDAHVLAVIDKTRTHQLLVFFKRMTEQELSQFIIYKS